MLTIDLGCGQIGARNHRCSLFRTEARADDPLSLRTPIDSFVEAVRICLTLAAIVIGLAFPVSGLDPNKTISQFTHTSWSAKDGIPGPVQAIAQTPDGYLWLGTPAGLYRFDGLQFASWEAAPGGEKLPRSAILSLFTARDGSLWIGFASNAISRLRNGTLTTYSPADGLHAGGVLTIAEDQNGSIWAGGEYGFSRFENARWNKVGAELGYPAPGARQLVVDRRGTLWVATDGMNFGFNKDSIRVNTILKLARNGKRFEATGQPVGYVAQLAEAPDGEIWMAEASGPGPTVRPVHGTSGPNIEREVQTAPWCVLFDGRSSLWIGLFHGGGILRAPDFKHLEQASVDRFESKDGLSSDAVRAAFQDREGNIWFGTNRGLDRFRENKATPFAAKEGVGPDSQRALTSTGEGTVWIINYTQDLVQRVLDGRIVSQRLPRYSRSVSTRVLSVYSGKNDRVWLGGSFGLAESTDGNFSYIRVPDTTDTSSVEAITSDSSGNLWIVVWKGYQSVVKRLRNGVWTDFRDSPELPNYRCRVLFGDAFGRVWFGFESGEVAVYENDKFHRYSASDGLPPGKILSITSNRAGRLWVSGTGGLSRFDGHHFATLTKENGLPGDSVSAVLEDDAGFLWLSGALGIVRVSPQEIEKAFTSSSYRMQTLFLDTTDGLPGLPPQEEPFPTATKAADGRLWFVTTDGMAVIDPRRLPMNAVPPPIAIQTVKADDRPFTISPQLQLHFRPKVRNVEVGFAALSLSVPERVRFRYKLEGYDTDWRGPVGARVATYTNLAPRRYRFRVTGCNNDGVWNENGATLEFDIAPMFYQTSWFLLLCGITASLLLAGAYRLRLRRITAEMNARLDERVSERTRLARELHDTLIQTIHGSKMVADAGLDDPVDPARVFHALERVSSWLEQATQEGRAALTALRTSTTQWNDLAEALERAGENCVFNSPITFALTAEGVVRDLHPIVRDEVYRIGYEAMRNACSHSRGTRLDVELSYARNLVVRVRDNGIGIDQGLAAKGKEGHFGIRGMHERAGRIGAKLRLKSTSPGTEAELIVPGNLAFRDEKGAPEGLLTKLRRFFRLGE